MALGPWCFSFFSSLLIASLGEFFELQTVITEQRVESSELEEDMPSAWDKRLVQTSPTSGEVVVLLRRSNEPGFWLVHGPSGITKIRLGDKRVVRTETQGPKNGVGYTPSEVLTQGRRVELLAAADNLVRSGTGRVVVLGDDGTGRGRVMRRYMATFLMSPIWGWHLFKWSARKPVRFLGLLGGVWVVFECLNYWAFFGKIQEVIWGAYHWATKIKEHAAEASETFATYINLMQNIYDTTATYVEPWKIPVGFLVIGLLIQYGQEAASSETPLSTPADSGRDSGQQSPVEDAQAQALIQLGSTMKTQSDLLQTVAKRLEKLEEERKEQEDLDAEREAVRETRTTAAQEELVQRHNKTWEALRSKLDHFEQVLREDKGDAAGGPARKGEMVDQTRTPGGSSSSTDVKKQIDKEEGSQDGPSQRSLLMKKLKRQAQLPQEVFLEALEEYEEVDPETWATHFPPGFRERITPEVMAEIYSEGKTAKAWAKQWLKDKELGECDQAREILPPAASMDALFLVDRVKGAINHVGTEKKARKIHGIKMAFDKVTKQADWKKGSSNAKNWKSKIDEEMWSRYDPEKLDQTHVFINRKAEDEVRGEMEREANLMKAKNKLLEQSRR